MNYYEGSYSYILEIALGSYSKGDYMPLKKAFYFFEKLAKENDSDSQHFLGIFYRFGYVVKKGKKKCFIFQM
jgi:TPR repeat protein